MPTSINPFSGPLWGALLLLAFPVPLFAQGIPTEGGDIKVKADRMISRSNPKQINFSGKVHATQEDLVVRCRELIVYYPKKDSAVERIAADRNVVITSPTRKITGQHADMYPKIKKIVITGNATLVQKNEDVKGEKIIYFYDRDDIIISGGSNNRAKLKLRPAPKGENGK